MVQKEDVHIHFFEHHGPEFQKVAWLKCLVIAKFRLMSELLKSGGSPNYSVSLPLHTSIIAQYQQLYFLSTIVSMIHFLFTLADIDYMLIC